MELEQKALEAARQGPATTPDPRWTHEHVALSGTSLYIRMDAGPNFEEALLCLDDGEPDTHELARFVSLKVARSFAQAWNAAPPDRGVTAATAGLTSPPLSAHEEHVTDPLADRGKSAALTPQAPEGAVPVAWRTFKVNGRPVATSVLAAFFDRGIGNWVFDVLDNPTLMEAETYTHWVLLDELSPGRIASPQPSVVPEGMVMVPREPTEAMVQAACDATFAPRPMTPEEMHRVGYRAMLSAVSHPDQKEAVE